MNPANPSSLRPVFGQPPSPAAELRRRWRSGPQPAVESFLSSGRRARQRSWRQSCGSICGSDGGKASGRWPVDYFARFPELLADAELAIDLIYAEFLIREEVGAPALCPTSSSGTPQFAEVLGDQIGLHQALAIRDGGAADDTWISGEARQRRLFERMAATDRLPQLPGDYEVLEEIGRGGMGIVYKARQLGLNRLVALKMMRDIDTVNREMLARFRAEAEVVASLHHPNIVQVYDYGEHDGLPYLALELVAGGTLAAQDERRDVARPPGRGAHRRAGPRRPFRPRARRDPPGSEAGEYPRRGRGVRGQETGVRSQWRHENADS